MSGIYLHIPFCKQACHYCDFHFSTSMKGKEELLQAMRRELELRRDYLGDDPDIHSVYFGGGTPSLLSESELQALFEQIHRLFRVSEEAEITLEANPDDLSTEKIHILRNSPVNRLSIGIQSFSATDLDFFNRAHSAEEALSCVEKVREAGFEQITLDLIYGSPTTSDRVWEENVRRLIDWQIPHLSCYALTVEPRTALAHFIRSGKAPPVMEEKSIRQFERLMEMMDAAGYEQYEISNFALPGQRAVHNSSYWLGEPYLGIGPSAHSFDGRSRQWNRPNNAMYTRSILQEGQVPFEMETLTAGQRYNEYVLTRLRTAWGCTEADLRSFGSAFYDHFQQAVQPFVRAKKVIAQGETYILSRTGKLLADRIAMELFWAD